jgi:hypothetical protein
VVGPNGDLETTASRIKLHASDLRLYAHPPINASELMPPLSPFCKKNCLRHNSNGRTIFVADAHRDDKRFVVRADEKLTAFVELESAIRALATRFNRRTFGGL